MTEREEKTAKERVRHDFLALAAAQEALRFGTFTLKSGRESPYFFNAGAFSSGKAMAGLGRAYAASAQGLGAAFDVVFGPAYKGIPIATAMATALAEHHGQEVGLAYNRKEAKDHGEGGQLVGAALAGQRVLLVDDVITAGTAIREVLPLLEAAGAQLVAVLTALDRQERGAEGTRSAVQMLEAELQVPVRAIVTLDDILDWLATENQLGEQAALAAYRARYGASA